MLRPHEEPRHLNIDDHIAVEPSAASAIRSARFMVATRHDHASTAGLDDLTDPALSVAT